jgi:hypothetical protein
MRRLLVPIALVLAGAAIPPPAARADDTVRFDRDIRPILSDNCFFCHGPDKKQRKASLRLDDRDVAVKKGAIVPGKPDDSELVARILATDDNVMPPKESNKKLTDKQKDLLRRWIAQGATYSVHWAYAPLNRPAVPAVGDPTWVKNPIDAFVLHNLDGKNIRPSPEAEKARLLRRLSLDLTGLPPTPEELHAFLTDNSPNAYEKQVDRLLASPHYGERMAAAWLDLARFSDTVGFHGDQNQNIFPYRDYVIDSFNRNTPFDRFTLEQLAGDLLPNATVEQKTASGFNRLNMMTREGGAQPKEYLAKYAADRVRTVATTWLGSTMGCCECHDHKFDPFSTRDFYSLAAFFADVKQWGVYNDYPYTPNPDLKGFNNDYPFPPEIEVTSPYLVRRAERLRRQIGALAGSCAADGFPAWCDAARGYLARHPDGWHFPPVSGVKSATEEGKALDDGSVLVTGSAKRAMPKKGAQEEREITLRPEAGRLAALRLELLPDEAHKGSTLRGGQTSSLVRLSATLKTKAGKSVPLRFHRTDAEEEQPRYASGEPIIGVLSGWKTAPKHARSRQQAVWLADPVTVGEGDELIVKLSGDALGRVRLATSPFASLDPLSADLGPRLALALAGRSAEQTQLLHTTYLISTAADAAAFARFKGLQRDLLECRGGKTWTLVTEAWESRVTRVLPRGNWLDERGEIVQPAVPHFLPQPANPAGRRLTRLDLAHWLVAKDNPLTARAVVNRFWKQFFGTGLSAAVDDLGAQGEPPSHPELLDWLAVEFRDGWDVKHLVKLIVMSNTYRQDSRVRPELKEIDPANRLLAAQSPRRLEAEFVRDNALFVAGLLDPEVGGPSARPYQPAGYYAALQFPDRDYVAHTDGRQYRRGVYTWWQRTFLHPMLANFDAPSREDCTANRVVSNTPQQALTLLNDPSFVEAARVFAARVLASVGSTDAARLDWAFGRVLARPAHSVERESLLKFLADQTAYYQAHPDEAHKLLRVGLAPLPKDADEPRLAAWTACCRALLNLHETITRY